LLRLPQILLARSSNNDFKPLPTRASSSQTIPKGTEGRLTAFCAMPAESVSLTGFLPFRAVRSPSHAAKTELGLFPLAVMLFIFRPVFPLPHFGQSLRELLRCVWQCIEQHPFHVCHTIADHPVQ
jgi:hypothetical protein